MLLFLGTHALKRHCRAHCCCCYFLSSCFFPFISDVYFVYCERRTERMIAQRPRIYICTSWCLCRNTKTADSFQYVLNMRIRFALPSLLFPFHSYPTYVRSGGAHTRSARLTHPSLNVMNSVCAFSIYSCFKTKWLPQSQLFGFDWVYFCSISLVQRNKDAEIFFHTKYVRIWFACVILFNSNAF